MCGSLCHVCSSLCVSVNFAYLSRLAAQLIAVEDLNFLGVCMCVVCAYAQCICACVYNSVKVKLLPDCESFYLSSQPS